MARLHKAKGKVKPLRVLAEHFYNLWIEEILKEESQKEYPGIKKEFQFLPQLQQDAWERVARDAVMESSALAQLKKTL